MEGDSRRRISLNDPLSFFVPVRQGRGTTASAGMVFLPSKAIPEAFAKVDKKPRHEKLEKYKRPQMLESRAKVLEEPTESGCICGWNGRSTFQVRIIRQAGVPNRNVAYPIPSTYVEFLPQSVYYSGL